VIFSLYAKEYKAQFTSSIPIPTTTIMNISIDECGADCANKLREDGKIFHLLSLDMHNDDDYKSEEKSLNLNHRSEFSYENIGTIPNKIAILLPSKKIKRYSQTTVDSIVAYAAPRRVAFDIKIYDSKTEDFSKLKKELMNISSDGYDKVIAVLTTEGARRIADIVPKQITMFIPTVNKKDMGTNFHATNIIFGGVNYETQLKELVGKCTSHIKVINYDNQVGTKLGKMTSEATGGRSSSYTIKESDTKIESLIKNSGFKDSCLVLNTPVVKSSVLLSALTYYDRQPKTIISTEINYHELILSSTMYRDRKNMILATSKKPINNIYYENVKTLSNNLEYNWVNYSTLIAADYFISKILNVQREFDNQIVDNQVIYEIELIRPAGNKFVPIKSSSSEKR
jgi:hypothetical protein